MTQITSPFRLPGVYFLPAHRIGTQQLPPLDVVAFVGFAERGPLHLPVLIEDMDSFEAIFGGDFALAKEMDSPGITSTDSLPNDISASHVTNAKGRTVYANLPQTVGAFFANGGRRCYIVRVCGKKSTETRIQLQGMTAIEPDGSTRPMDVYVSASSPGRWSSSLRLSTRLDTKELPSHKFYLNNTHQITWESSNQPRVIQSGDLLRLTMNDGEQWLFPVTSIIEKPTKFTLQAETVWRIQTPVATSLPDIFEADLTIPQSFLRVEPDNTPFSVPTLSRIERLRFDLLLINDTKKYRITIRDLAFNSPHSRFWGEAILLESSPLGRRSSVEGTFPQTSLSNALVNAEKNPSLRAAELFRKLQSLERIDISPKSVETSLLNGLLSGLLAPLENDNQLIFLPMEMSSKYSDPVAANPEDIGKDDLDRLDAGLFLDKFLVPEPHNISSAAAKSLMAAATDQYYVQNKRLYGLHSLAFIDEVALISIPDANHRGWL
ncbi:hypothetical protein, partial [Nitrosomonas nitrosa]|uniref:hypothetical protein n=1 Tax=Nitrosomonas nitrosa TaxID=52442 RepID=UPI0023F910C1